MRVNNRKFIKTTEEIMTREEIIQQGRPVEPNCFETDREEQWYKVGLYDGAMASPWHKNIDSDLPKKSGRYLVMAQNGFCHTCTYKADSRYWDTIGYQSDIKYWMEIPKLPK